MKLNLGCGKKIFDGYENIDWPTDIRKLSYDNNSCDEIMAIHVFEHFYRHEAPSILKHWYDLLKPSGKLILEMPSFYKILNLSKTIIDHKFLLYGLYGNQEEVVNNSSMQHLWCWSESELKKEMKSVGFKVHFEEPRFHNRIRDMRLVGTKP